MGHSSEIQTQNREELNGLILRAKSWTKDSIKLSQAELPVFIEIQKKGEKVTDRQARRWKSRLDKTNYDMLDFGRGNLALFGSPDDMNNILIIDSGFLWERAEPRKQPPKQPFKAPVPKRGGETGSRNVRAKVSKWHDFPGVVILPEGKGAKDMAAMVRLADAMAVEGARNWWEDFPQAVEIHQTEAQRRENMAFAMQSLLRCPGMLCCGGQVTTREPTQSNPVVVTEQDYNDESDSEDIYGR